ncbi:hypothetical protein ESCOMM068B2_21160 [Escherichia coli]|nr:hypothetical protein VEE21_32860 [Escherichia coli]
MVDTEIWLRLMSISSLYGDDMVRIAHWVAKQSHIEPPRVSWRVFYL